VAEKTLLCWKNQPLLKLVGALWQPTQVGLHRTFKEKWKEVGSRVRSAISGVPAKKNQFGVKRGEGSLPVRGRSEKGDLPVLG